MSLARIALALLAATALLGACSGEPDFEVTRVEHDVAKSAPKPLPDKAPSPGGYQRSWRLEFTTATGPESPGEEPHLIGAHVVVVGESGVTAYDARSGKRRWRYQEPGRKLDGFATTDGVIVVRILAAGQNVTDEHLVGLDAGTGKRLWDSYESWELLGDGGVSASGRRQQGEAAAGVVPVKADVDDPDDGDRVIGLSARTGEEKWSLRSGDVADGCTPKRGTKADGDDPVLALALSCDDGSVGTGSRSTYAVVDAGSGVLRWALDSDMSRAQALLDGITVWSTDGAPPTLYDSRGRRIFTAEKGSECNGPCSASDTGGRVVVSYDAPGNKSAAVAVDPRTGKADRLGAREAEFLGTAAAAGGTAVGPLPAPAGGPVDEPVPNDDADRAPTVPHPLEVRDLASGRSDVVMLPPSADGATTEPFGFGGDRIYLLESANPEDTAGGARVLSAYSLRKADGKGQTAGVSAAEWPEPCALLKGAPLDSPQRDASRQPAGAYELGDMVVPATRCELNSVPMIDVEWVAASAAEADQLLSGTAGTNTGADEELIVGDEDDDQRFVVRVGRYVVSVASPHEIDDLERRYAVARTVVKNLRALAAAR